MNMRRVNLNVQYTLKGTLGGLLYMYIVSKGRRGLAIMRTAFFLNFSVSISKTISYDITNLTWYTYVLAYTSACTLYCNVHVFYIFYTETDTCGICDSEDEADRWRGTRGGGDRS